jgi:hypothetical protein
MNRVQEKIPPIMNRKTTSKPSGTAYGKRMILLTSVHTSQEYNSLLLPNLFPRR